MIGIVEIGNSDAVHRALRRIGQTTEPYENSGEYNGVVLPGIGHFAYCMDRLRDGRIDIPLLKERIDTGTKLLGICVGAQMLFETSEEAPLGPTGLGWIPGQVTRVVGRAPRMGWYSVDGYHYYFVHSFEPPNPLIQWGNMTAAQFHPEKSGSAGLRFLREWAT